MPGFLIMRPPTAPLRPIAPTTQDIAIVVCGGGDPFAEWELAREMCERVGKTYSIFVGNDMIEFFPDEIDHAVSLHPDKLRYWLPARKAAGYNQPKEVWAHRNYEGAVTRWSRDWSGSTGLFCIKIARELGHVHIVSCGVHMDTNANHFVRKEPWLASDGFRRGWTARIDELRPYYRSMGGWTRQEFGAPTEEWLRTEIEDEHIPRSGGSRA